MFWITDSASIIGTVPNVTASGKYEATIKAVNDEDNGVSRCNVHAYSSYIITITVPYLSIMVIWFELCVQGHEFCYKVMRVLCKRALRPTYVDKIEPDHYFVLSITKE